MKPPPEYEVISMERIESFNINHNKLVPGMYVSRRDNGITTYDIRMRRPNKEKVIDNDAIHTIEHLFATYVRNSEYSDNIVYFGPMGCRTGCYFLTRDMSDADAVELTKKAFDFIASYKGKIPGASRKECGNFKEHNLKKARKEAKVMLKVLKNTDSNNLCYPR